jgi:large conductance mechanosensitive channel
MSTLGDDWFVARCKESTQGTMMMSEQAPSRSLLRAPGKQVSTLLDEFKNFAFKGNVVDLAVAVIIGMAFGKIVDSLVKHVIMPLISVLVPGEGGYLAWVWIVNGTEIPYGLFLGEVVNFLIVAAALFIFIVKFLGWLMKSKKQEAPPGPPRSPRTRNCSPRSATC